MSLSFRRHLPSYIQVLINWAERQPDPYVAIVIDKAADNGISIVHERFIQLFLKQFDTPLPFPYDFNKGVASALAGLSRAIQDANDDELLRDIEDMIVPYWERLWAWIRCLTFGLGSSLEEERAKRRILLDVGFLFFFLLRQSDRSKLLIVETKDILRFSMKMYLEIKRGPYTPEDALNTITITDSLALLLEHPSTPFVEVVDVLGTNRKSAADALFAPLHRAKDAGKASPRCLDSYCHVLVNLFFRNTTYLQTFLPVRSVISTLCDISWTVANRLRGDSVDNHYSGQTLKKLLGFILVYGVEEPDFKWILIALQHNLLKVLLIAVEVGQHHNLPQYFKDLLQPLTAYVLFRPVMKQVIIDPSYLLTLEGKINLKGPMKDVWQVFIDSTNFAQGVHAEFDDLEVSTRQCHNISCPTPTSDKLRRCMGCKAIFYCSTMCQKADWSSHRKHCGRSASYQNFPNHPRTTKFLEYITKRELVRRSTEIIEHRDKILTGTAANDHDQNSVHVHFPLIILLDFTQRLPPTIHLSQDEKFVNDWYNQHLREGGSNTASTSRIPIIAPFIEVVWGSWKRPILVCHEISGTLFGWAEPAPYHDSSTSAIS